MATSLQDAKIQVTLDTREAKRALKNLENQLDPGKMGRLRTIAQKQKGKDDATLFTKFMNQVTGRVPGPPGASHAARLAAQSGVFSKRAVAGLAGGTVAAFKGVEYGPALFGGIGSAVGEEIFGEELEKLNTKVKDALDWFDEGMDELSQSFTVLENSVTKIFTASKVASSAALMTSGAGIPMDGDFFWELFQRQYDVSQAQDNLNTEMNKVFMSRGAKGFTKMLIGSRPD
jgi:hypothetical protein